MRITLVKSKPEEGMSEKNWKLLSDKIEFSQAELFHIWTKEIVTALNALPGYRWVGFYWIIEDMLYLGAWVGPAATEHVAIPVGQGICGLAARTHETVIVDDVSKDPRYLQCFLDTKSEIVVPVFRDGDSTKDVVGEIDVDGDKIATFTTEDRKQLEAIAVTVGKSYPNGFDPRNRN